jgi:hypothetical protein
MTINLNTLWDFNQPEISEQRFRAALLNSTGDDTLILQTQIARTYGIRANFVQAQQILAEIEPRVAHASLEAQVYYHLELGRSYSSATHPPETQTAEAKDLARSSYLRAVELAQVAHLDGLAIDALHMLAFVDTTPEEQVKWNRKALDLLKTSTQPEAKKWEASLRNNLGMTLHSLEQYPQALAEFELALAAREHSSNPESIRIARWMIAWTLRSLGRLNEALAMQLALEQECAAAGAPDPYVLEELALLYRALGDDENAALYAARREKKS